MGVKGVSRFQFPKDWISDNLGSYVNITSGISPSKIKLDTFGIPYYKVDQLNLSNKYLCDTPYHINSEIKIKKGSLIFPKRGASIFLNKVRILSEDSYMDTNLMTLTTNENLINEYLYYFLIYIQLWKIADTTSIPQINNKHINPLAIILPPLPEQHAIAEALSDIDALIAAQEALIAKKFAIKHGVMQELLTGKRRLPGFSGVWEETKLGDLADLYQPITISQSDLMDDGYLVYGANGIIGKYDRYNHEKWQITITCRGSTCGTVNRTEEKSWITGNAMVINFDTKLRVDKNFMYNFLSLQDFSLCITGSGQPQIVRTPLNEYLLTIPSELNEQQAIADVIGNMDAEITALEQKLEKTRLLKQGMMQELLTGRIRLTGE